MTLPVAISIFAATFVIGAGLTAFFGNEVAVVSMIVFAIAGYTLASVLEIRQSLREP